ncbi:hypothetical protein M758_12G109900 [Ceratodon purpureus]|uniref:Uncharacterized protein n=1 Tax=Ceratodon purpureus TaxID=3225 RepID=A0A8T0G710_CERPU|nr:hypothetical protein KC19_12G105900 [Ceratodon purpureus]KAG0554625.1 hypothetical protein KC19_12G106100 [Ceratodon purpureus]KAG0598884.1 hypothetical protein M758_12G108700 [Ceratodon purpureus]KAG0598896.1 hypothetical protein M758_12G109900 [Ceratodon purpureus]
MLCSIAEVTPNLVAHQQRRIRERSELNQCEAIPCEVQIIVPFCCTEPGFHWSRVTASKYWASSSLWRLRHLSQNILTPDCSAPSPTDCGFVLKSGRFFQN